MKRCTHLKGVCARQVLFSSSSAALSFGFSHLLNAQFALVFGLCCMGASLMGVLLISRIVERSGKVRQLIITFGSPGLKLIDRWVSLVVGYEVDLQALLFLRQMAPALTAVPKSAETMGMQEDCPCLTRAAVCKIHCRSCRCVVCSHRSLSHEHVLCVWEVPEGITCSASGHAVGMLRFAGASPVAEG